MDALSSYLWVRGLKRNRADEVSKVLAEIASSRGHFPAVLTTDAGTEFCNGVVETLLKENDVTHHVSPPPLKAQVKSFFKNTRDIHPSVILKTNTRDFQLAEAYVKIVKGKIYKLIAETGKRRYIDKLPALVAGLNGRHLRAIGTSPERVDFHNQFAVFHRRYDNVFKHGQKNSPTLKVGTIVRLRLRKSAPFAKGYAQTFSAETYRIRSTKNAPPTVMYKLEDAHGDPVHGFWYKESLTPAFIAG